MDRVAAAHLLAQALPTHVRRFASRAGAPAGRCSWGTRSARGSGARTRGLSVSGALTLAGAASARSRAKSLAVTQHLSESLISQEEARGRHCGRVFKAETKMPVFCVAQLPEENVHLFSLHSFHILSGI